MTNVKFADELAVCKPEIAEQIRFRTGLIKMYRKRALRRQNGKCFHCGCLLTKLTATADHLIPRSKGGSDSEENIVASCLTCNQAKADTAP